MRGGATKRLKNQRVNGVIQMRLSRTRRRPKREDRLIKSHMTGYEEFMCGKVKTQIPFVMRRVTKEHTWGRLGKELVSDNDTLIGVEKAPKDKKVVKGWSSVQENLNGRPISDSGGREEVKEVDNSLESLRPVRKRDRSMIKKSPHSVTKGLNDTLCFPVLR